MFIARPLTNLDKPRSKAARAVLAGIKNDKSNKPLKILFKHMPTLNETADDDDGDEKRWILRHVDEFERAFKVYTTGKDIRMGGIVAKGLPRMYFFEPDEKNKPVDANMLRPRQKMRACYIRAALKLGLGEVIDDPKDVCMFPEDHKEMHNGHPIDAMLMIPFAREHGNVRIVVPKTRKGPMRFMATRKIEKDSSIYYRRRILWKGQQEKEKGGEEGEGDSPKKKKKKS